MKKHTKKILKFGITIIILVVLFWKFNLKLSALVSEVDCWLYIALAACLPVSIIPFFSVNRWKLFLSESGINERFFSLWRINLVSIFQGLVIPSSQGFDVLRMYYIERRNPGKRGTAGSTVVIERLFGLAILASFCVLALPFVKFSGNPLPLYISVFLVAVGSISIFVLLVTPFFHRLYQGKKTRFQLLNRIIAYIERLHGAMIVFPYRKVFLSTICFISGFQLSLILCVYLVFMAYGQHIPFLTHLAVYPVICIYTMIPVTIGGFGVREGCFAFFYAQLGVPPDIAICVSITNYIIISLIPATIGGVLFLLDGMFEMEPLISRDMTNKSLNPRISPENEDEK